MIRNSFGDRLGGVHWLNYFPEARAIAARRWPSVDATVEAFESAGFRMDDLKQVPEQAAADLRAYLKRIGVRDRSTLTPISDEAFREGLERLREAAAGSEPSPVVDLRDLLVLRKERNES